MASSEHRSPATASANHAFVAASAEFGDWRPDIVHAHDWEVGWAADVLATLFDVPLVTTFHGTERGRHGGHLPPGRPTDINSVEWWLAFRSRRVIASTRLMVREIIGGFELDPDLVRRVPNGIDPAWWAAASAGRIDSTTREQCDERPCSPWGRVQYEKGFHVLARAVAALRAAVPGSSA